MLRIHEIKLNMGEGLDELPRKILTKLRRGNLEITSYKVIKESIDARDKASIKLVYTVDFSVITKDSAIKDDELEEKLLLGAKGIKLEKSSPMDYVFVAKGNEELIHRPVIAGFGPCGMFAALILAEMGYQPIIIERGKPIEERVKDVVAFWDHGTLNPESNVQFGEGGAGAFSDGKLTTQIKDTRVRKVLEEFVSVGGAEDILYKQKPHVGTDVLRRVVINIRKKIIELGGEILFESSLIGLDVQETDGERILQGIMLNGDRHIKTNHLILAIGHSARDTFRSLFEQGIAMEQKPFSMGVRIEHPQEMINEAQYGKEWSNYGLGAADYKLSHHCKNGRGVYTFCMCPGGQVIAAASQAGGVVTNGMSYHARGGKNANSGLLVDVRIEDFSSTSPLAGIEFQEKYEGLAFEAGGNNYKAPAQKVGDFMAVSGEKRCSKKEAGSVICPKVQPMEASYKPGIASTELSRCLPEFVTEALREAIPELGKKLKGFDSAEAVMTGVETRSSSPLRIKRGKDFMGSVTGLFPGGEGAGYAGGIVSAAVDGIKIAEEIAKKYNEPTRYPPPR